MLEKARSVRESMLREEKEERGRLHYLNNTEKMSKLIKFHDSLGSGTWGRNFTVFH